MGAHHLPIQMGRRLRQPRSMRVCHMCRSGALCDERHILLECPALGDLRSQYAPLIAESSGVIFAGAHYALLELLVMSAISVLNAHFLMELELSMLICMTAVVVPCAPLCGTRTRRMFLIA